MSRAVDTADVRPLILLVEDDVALGRALQFTLQIDGYLVELLDSAEALLEREFPGGLVCVITDFYLPGLSGIDALEMLRRRDVTAPAILMTTQPSPRLVARAQRAGVAVLEKPILDGRLKTAIKAVCN